MAHWYGPCRSPYYLLSCRPLLGLEMGDTLTFRNENGLTRRGCVLSLREPYQTHARAPFWMQELLLADIHAA